MARMIDRMFAGLGALALAAAATTIATAQTAGPGEPVLTGDHGWEDGQSTIFGSNAPNNVTAVNVGDFVNSGDRALRVTESPHSTGTVHVYLGHVRNLEHGDIVRASFWTYDDVPDTQPRVRIWAHYTIGESVEPVAQAGGNNAYSQGIGWEELSNDWTFSAFTGACNGDCDGLVIQARLYSPDPGCDTCSTDYWFDDLAIEAYCATDPNLTILFPDGTQIGDPLTPHELCQPGAGEPGPCPDPNVTADYGWEDGVATILGGQSIANVTVANVTDFVHTGTNSLRATENGHTSSARILYVAHVKNLTDGDVVNAGFWTYDDTPGPGTEQDPAGSVRIWARYTSGDGIGSPSAFPPGSNNETYSSGIGWEQMSHSWIFDSSLGDGVVIEARLYGSPATCPACSMDYWIDDLWVDVCSSNPQAVVIDFPPDSDPGDPDPPVEPCTDPDIAANYTWQDGEGTIIGGTQNAVITAVNSTEMVHTGANALKVTESPHHPSQNPQVWLAHIRNLQDGDRVTGSFWTYDDTPETEPGQVTSGYPSVRIWAHYTSGSSLSAQGQAGGNLEFSSGIGWEELSHTWEFDSNNGARDGLVIQARLYSPECPDGQVCSTDYFIDTLTVNVCANSPQNIIVLLPDDFVFEPEPPIEMCPDPLAGDYGWEDGKSTIIGASSSAIEAFNITDQDGHVFSGDRALKIVETGHVSGAREIYLALVENLAPDDTIRAGFMTYDDKLDASPRVRIWARYAVTGDPFLKQSAGGKEEFSAGTGWEELEHIWLFDPPVSDPPRNALMIMARIYSANCDNPPCVAEYFFDDMFVEACGDHPNLTITFADGSVFGEPGEPQDCVADVDGSGTIDIFDLFAVLGAWGTSDVNADVNGDGLVDGADLGIVLASYGPCSEFLVPMTGSAQLILEDTAAPGGLRQYDLYVKLDPGEALVNIFDADVTSSLGFEGGSFITIGADSPHFDIAEDPNFDFSAFSSGTSLGTNAGWYNFDPPNNLGLADLYPDHRVLIARFFINPDSEFDADLFVSYEDGDGRARQVGLTLHPDVTPCPADLTGSGSVGVPDLLALLSCWGPVVPGAGCENADLTDSGSVGVPDLLALLSQWGPCPR